MPTLCSRQLLTLTVAVIAWATAIGLTIFGPEPTSTLRLVFFCALGVSISSTTLTVFPWVVAGFIQQTTLAFVAGYMHREADELLDAEGKPHLQVVGD